MEEKEIEIEGGFNPLKIETEQDLWLHLNTPPKPEHIREKNRVKYIPISIIEAKLRQFFGPMGVQVKNPQWSTVINEQVGSLDLLIKNPVTGEWLTYTGFGAVQIQLRKGSQAIDVASKIPNAMEKMHPKLKAACIKNAVKFLGAAFGGNIGRREEDTETISQELGKELLTDLMAQIEFAETITELNAVRANSSNFFEQFAGVRKKFAEREKVLSGNMIPEKLDAQTLFDQND